MSKGCPITSETKRKVFSFHETILSFGDWIIRDCRHPEFFSQEYACRFTASKCFHVGYVFDSEFVLYIWQASRKVGLYGLFYQGGPNPLIAGGLLISNHTGSWDSCMHFCRQIQTSKTSNVRPSTQLKYICQIGSSPQAKEKYKINN